MTYPSNKLNIIICCGLLGLVACNQQNEKAEPYKTAVDYPKTAPLEAGVSISQSVGLTALEDNKTDSQASNPQNEEKTEADTQADIKDSSASAEISEATTTKAVTLTPANKDTSADTETAPTN